MCESARKGSAPVAAGPAGIRARAFVVALLLIPLDQYWVLMMEKVRSGPYPTTMSIFANAVFILALLVVLNGLLRRLSRRLTFSAGELLLIYSMVAVAAALAGHDMMPTLIGMMTYPWQFATPENQWTSTWIPHLPESLSVTAPSDVHALWEGNSSLLEHWRPWAWPVAQWVVFITVLGFMISCVNALVRKSWMEHERLSFPIVQLPLAMTEPDTCIWRSRLFWLGFGLAGSVDLINGLHTYFPLTVPLLPVTHEHIDLMEGVTAKPWSALGWTPLSFYPFVLGLGYLLRADLLFSAWFFYWFWKLQQVAIVALAWDADPAFPYKPEQSFGGILAILLTLAYTSRGYWKQVYLKIAGGASRLDDSDEPLSYRAAALGAVAGLAYLCWFMMRIGMSPLFAIIAFGVYLVMATGITRIRAELGPPVHDFHFTGPDSLIPPAVGTGPMSKGDMVGLAYFWWYNRAYRAHPMPIGLESMKMAQVTSSSQRRFFWGIVAAIAVGAAATFWAYLYLGYKLGFAQGVSQGGVYASGAAKELDIWWRRAPDALRPNWIANAATLYGFGFCAVLYYLHLSVVGWPFHPIGFVITNSYAINLVWFPLLVAWTIKVSVLRFGGLKLYKRLLPVFLGLILGEMIVGSIWSLIGLTFDIPYYNFWGS